MMGRFALYVHIPYCRAKCPYCDFNSYAVQRWPEERYVAALRSELRHYARLPPWRGGEIASIFFGGGTPSLFAPNSINAILTEATRLWPVDVSFEVTLEANPGTVDLEKLKGLRAAGINRMSFGVQSFATTHLRRLGRIHNADEARAVIGLSRVARFANVSLDLIHGLPDQTLEQWEDDLRQVCALQPEHISAYSLTYEEGTPFHAWRAQGALRQLTEDIELAMFTRTEEILGAAGYERYEISNYARPGRACLHNLNYWHSGEYLGVGAGAHSYGRQADRSFGTRWSNEKDPLAYMQALEQHGNACASAEQLDARQARGEFVFLGLRCLEGFPAAAFRQRFGDDLRAVFPHVEGLCGDGLLQCTEGRWRLTRRGLLLADSVFATFL